jgi:cytochrome P450
MAKHDTSPGTTESQKRLPVTQGRLLDFPDDPAAVMRRLHETHGEIAALEEDGQRIVFVFGPRYNHQVLSDVRTFHSSFFPIRGPRNSAQRRLTSGLLNMNGDDHKRHRRLVAGPFQKGSIVNYQQGIIDLAQAMVDQWRPGEVRDMAREMNQYMLRVASSMLFGFDQPELAYAIGRGTDRWITMNHRVGMGAYVADNQISGSYQDLLQQAEELEVLIRKMLELRRSSAPGNDVLSLLLQARDDDGKGMTEGELIGQAAVIFGAAHLTTAYSLTWALFLLSQHPAVAADVVQELRDTLRGEPPTLEQVEQIPLLDRAVKESMRILPASAYSQRVTAEPVQLGPLSLPRGTAVIFTPFVSHRLPEQFAQPDRYLPQRWDGFTPAPYAYIPFAAGPRLCLGAAVAMMTIKTTLPIILQRYRLSVVPGAAINGRVIATMLAPTAGMPMVISPVTVPFTASPVAGNIHDLMDLQSGSAMSRSYQHAA